MRTVIVTGGASGIGLATCEVLAARRARIVQADWNTERARAEASRLADRGAAVKASEVDVADPGAVESVVAEAAEGGNLAGLVNAAGLLQLGMITDVSVEDWDRVVEVNPLGVRVVEKPGHTFTRRSGHVRRQERSSEPCVEESYIMEVRVARRIAPCVVRHLRLRRQAGDAATGDAPRRCEGGGWMLERPPVVTFEVAVTSIVEPDRVNIHFSATLVA